jgi:hypothetical protein
MNRPLQVRTYLERRKTTNMKMKKVLVLMVAPSIAAISTKKIKML